MCNLFTQRMTQDEIRLLGDVVRDLTRSFSITADIEVPQNGGEGMLNTLGGRFGGYGFYLLKGKPVFDYNLLALKHFRWEGKDALSPGKHTVVFDFTYDGPGAAKGGTRCAVGRRRAGCKTGDPAYNPICHNDRRVL